MMSKLNKQMDSFSTQFDSMQKEMEFIGGQVEDLGGKVESLEVAAEQPDVEDVFVVGDEKGGDGENAALELPADLPPQSGPSARPEGSCKTRVRDKPF